ncbi:hypothetical protein [Paucibacter soli]|uniref:hypothetical protein n=1 Tax=Paucibacter soli TaxID=3133433 RepID=UPI0030A013BB
MPALAPVQRPAWLWPLLLLLHAAALLMLGQAQGPKAAKPLHQRLTVWLLQQPPPKSPPAKPAQTRSMPRAEPAAAAPPVRAVPEPVPAAAPRAAEPGEPAPTPRSSVAPLLLSLPAGPAASQAWRNPALGDARSNTRRPSLEDKLAQAMDSEADRPDEIIGTTKRRVRYRGGCYDIEQPRNAQLDAFNESMRQSPALTKPCKGW